jgi:mono/diheme cytochrome c family protein
MPEKSRVLNVVAFLLSAFITPAGLAACANQTPTPVIATTPTATGSSGGMVFARYCNVCHPGGGKGAGPSLLNLSMTASQMKDLVRHGKARMPGYGSNVITDDDLNALIEFVQQLDK